MKIHLKSDQFESLNLFLFKGKRECGPYARSAPDINGLIMGFKNMFDNRQTEP